MSVALDFEFLQGLLEAGVVTGSVLELGSRLWPGSSNAESVVRAAGLNWSGCDIEPGPGVDFTLDVLSADAVAPLAGRWDAVLVMNLLEHVYDPIAALRNSMRLVRDGGICVVVGPAIWDLHDYPRDFWRPLPDFFLEFAEREGHTVLSDHMAWLVGGIDQVIPVHRFDLGQQKRFPSRHVAPELFGPTRTRISRAVHFAARTYGRAFYFPYCGLGVVLERGRQVPPE